MKKVITLKLEFEDHNLPTITPEDIHRDCDAVWEWCGDITGCDWDDIRLFDVEVK